MSVSTLTLEETRAFLDRHPEIDAADIPTYGLTVYEGDYKYLVALRSSGEVVVIDITAREDGEPIGEFGAYLKGGLFDLWGAIDPYSREWSRPGGLFEDITDRTGAILKIAVIGAVAIGGVYLWRKSSH